MCLYTVTRDLSKQEAKACIFCVFPKKGPIIDINIEYVLFYNEIPLFLYEKKTKSVFRSKTPSQQKQDFQQQGPHFFSLLFLKTFFLQLLVWDFVHILLDRQMNAGFCI